MLVKGPDVPTRYCKPTTKVRSLLSRMVIIEYPTLMLAKPVVTKAVAKPWLVLPLFKKPNF